MATQATELYNAWRENDTDPLEPRVEKLDGSGSLLWDFVFSSTEARPEDVVANSAGEHWVGFTDATVRKLAADGSGVVWSWTDPDDGWISSVDIDSSDNVYLGANFSGGSVIKLDSSGNLLWDKDLNTGNDVDHVRLGPDMTALCLDDAPLETALRDRSLDGAGRLAVCPARAPFERLARAKTPEAAEAFEDRIAEAARAFDHVLVDVPPVAANQAIAAVTTIDAVAVVADAPRASDAVPRAHDRLVDLGVDPAATVVTRTADHADADATVPTLDGDPPAVEDSEAAREHVGGVLAAAMGLTVDADDAGGLRDRLSL